MYEVRMFQFFFFIIFVRRIYAMYIHLYWLIFGINYFCLISKHRTDQMHAKEKKKNIEKTVDSWKQLFTEKAICGSCVYAHKHTPSYAIR